MKKFLRILIVLFLTAIFVFAVGAVVYSTVFMHSDAYVPFDKNKLVNVNNLVVVLDKDGNAVAEKVSAGGINYVKLSELAEHTKNAFVAVEDKRFYSHDGIDARRILGATLSNVKNGGYREGASTISQQLIKNTHLSNEKTLKRKLNEILLAYELEDNYSKDEILEMYLNTIYFGRNAYGIENAANAYFGKNAKDLTASESAVLAGIIKAPSTYSPDKNPEKCRERRDVVLRLMREQQMLSQSDFDTAKSAKMLTVPYLNNEFYGYTDSAIGEACRILNMSEGQLCSKKYTITTYLDKATQSAVEDTVKHADVTQKDGDTANVFMAVCTNDGKITALATCGQKMGKRQIGSTAKPFAVYAPAINEHLITEASPVLDEKTDFGGYEPSNYAEKYYGWTTVKQAVAKSLNVPAVKTLNSLTTDVAEKYLAKMNIVGKQNLSLALGNVTGGMDGRDLLSAYTSLSGGGVYSRATQIKQITDERGRVVYRDQTRQNRVFSTTTSYLMTDILKETAQSGTASKLGKIGQNVAAKTGTVGNSAENSDALVVGYTPELTFVAWVFGELPTSISGSGVPCELSAKLLSKLPRNNTDFVAPSGVERLAIDKNDLYNKQLVNLGCDQNVEYYYFDSTLKPTSYATHLGDYTITANMCDGQVVLTISATDYAVKVFKKGYGLLSDNAMGQVIDDELDFGDNIYYAELYDGDKKILTTTEVTVFMPEPEGKQPIEPLPDWLDFWYFK